MKAFCVWLLTFWVTRSLAAVSPTSLKVSASSRAKLGPPIDPGTLTTTTTVAPTVATTSLVEMASNATGNSTALNNTSVYDRKHKILLVVLSDLNVREVREPQQQAPGKTVAETHTAGTKHLNETLILDEQWFKEFLKKLQPTANTDGKIKCAESSKCINIVPHYVPPTFPWVIRKEPRKPIVYIEPIVCHEDTAKDSGVLVATSTSKRNKIGKRKPTQPVKANMSHARSRTLKSTGKRPRAGTADYVLMPKFGTAQDTPHSVYPLDYFTNIDYEHLARGSESSGYSSEEEE